MHVTILMGSPRTGGNTDIMAQTFAQGARESGHEVEIIDVTKKNVRGCLGCMYCFAHGGQCVQKDDMAGILEVLDRTDVIVFASPIYFFDITAQLKCVIDRLFARGSTGFKANKTALLLDAGGEQGFPAAITMYKSIVHYLKWQDLGMVTIAGLEGKEDVKASPKLKQVYELGKSI